MLKLVCISLPRISNELQLQTLDEDNDFVIIYKF